MLSSNDSCERLRAGGVEKEKETAVVRGETWKRKSKGSLLGIGNDSSGQGGNCVKNPRGGCGRPGPESNGFFLGGGGGWGGGGKTREKQRSTKFASKKG